MVMIIQRPLLKSHLILLGEGMGGGHGHTEHSSENVASSGTGKGWRHAVKIFKFKVCVQI